MLFRARTRPDPRPRQGRAMRPRLEALEIRLTPSATHLVIITPPPDIIAGQTFSETIAAEDDAGNVDTSYSGGVILNLVSNPGGVNLLGTTSVLMISGLATLSGLTVDSAGSYQLQAASGVLVASIEPSFNVRAGAAAQLVVTSQPPATILAGQTFGITVAVGDQFGNFVSSFNGNLALAPTDGAVEGSLGGVLTVQVANGQATFGGLSLVNAGTPFTLQVSTTGLPSVATSPFSVMAGQPTQLGVITRPPTNVGAGVGFGLVLAAEDVYGNVNSSYSGSASLALVSKLDPNSLVGNKTEPFSGGLATFTGLTLDQAGSGYALQATASGSTNLTSPPLNSLAFGVTAGAAARLVVTSQPPATVTAGQTFGLTVAVADQYGNSVISFSGSLAVAPTNVMTEGSLAGTLTMPLIGGVATFVGLSLAKAGTPFTLQVSGTGLPTVTTSPFTVSSSDTTTSGDGSSGDGSSGTSSSGTGSSGTTSSNTGSPGATSPVGGTSDALPRLVVSSQPTTVDAGRYFQLTVMVEDAGGATESNFNGKVTLALAADPGGATLGGTLTMPAIHGLLTFYGLTLDVAGSGYTIRATSGGFTSALSSPIAVVNPPALLAIATQSPSSTISTRSFGLTVSVDDALGRLAPGYNGKVTIALSGRHGQAKLHGTRTVEAINGVATFSGLSLSGARKGATLRIQATADGLPAATTNLSIGMFATTPRRSAIIHGKK